VIGTASNDVWMQVVTTRGQALFHWDGTNWGSPPAPIQGAEQVWPAGDELWVFGPNAQVRRWNRPDAPVAVDVGDRDPGPIWASSSRDIWMLSGRCEHYSLLGGCDQSSRFVARWNGGWFAEVPLGEDTQIQEVYGLSQSDVWLLGDGIQHIP